MHRLSVRLIFGARDLSSLARTHMKNIRGRKNKRRVRRGRRMMGLLALRQTNLREMFATRVQEITSATPLLRLSRFVE